MIKINQEKCIGCGHCVAVFKAFEMKDGKARVISQKINDIEGAIRVCPTQAISNN